MDKIRPYAKPHNRGYSRRSPSRKTGWRSQPSSAFKALLLSCLMVAATYFAYLVLPKDDTANAFLAQTAGHSPSWIPTLAQALPPSPQVQQGNQVILNNRPFPILWSQRQQSIGITDVGLTQLIGVSLLNTSDAAKQPLQWFSPPTAHGLTLSTWLTPQYRYLNITDLAQRAGWQMQITGSTLRISTPLSQIVGIRQGQQDWGDRIAIDLDRPTPWHLTEQDGEFTVALDAQVSPALLQGFMAPPGGRVTSLTIETTGNQTFIRVVSPARVRPLVSTLSAPNRLIIDIRPDSMMERDIIWAPGIRWRQQAMRVGNTQFSVVFLLINPRQPGLSLKPIWTNPSSAVGTAPLFTTAQRWQVAAAINGGFFNRNNQLPLGAVRQDNRWISGPILNRGAIAWNEQGDIAIDRLTLQETITTSNGQQFPVTLFNTGYVRAGLARYTSEWGATYTNIIDNEVIITTQNDQVIAQRPSGLQGQSTVAIPPNGYLLIARSFNTAATVLSPGTTLQRQTTITPARFDQYPQIVGAGPLLIQNRQVVLNPAIEQFTQAFIQQAATRSAIGTTLDGHIMIATLQSSGGGFGPTLSETAHIMQQLGAIDALNLDGGSSTTLYLGGQLLNRTPRTAARVHNGIGVFIQPGL